ncbi:hypothetical protein IE53DRAFT_370063 [Violaceomyces palustris]|uniref:Uncharacterized protein n=1 Tax=Violaceomyces palustris TaxID=1673888 RepID=A0ACD0NTL6_9BASI|nr:hypothetical protein IE53DRAFT_370063 [Violaceomyces palustris]
MSNFNNHAPYQGGYAAFNQLGQPSHYHANQQHSASPYPYQTQSPRGHRRGGPRGGPAGRGYHDSYQDNRESKEELRLRHIRSTLFKLAEDKDFHPPSDLLRLARWIEEKADDGHEAICATFRIIVTEQPHKIPLVASLLGFLTLSPRPPKKEGSAGENEQDPSATNEPESDNLGLLIVKDLVRAFRSYLDARLWRNTRLSLHLFASLVPLGIISASSLRALLASFAAVLEEPGVAASRGDRAAVCIIETMCRAGQDLLVDQGSEDGTEIPTDEARKELDALVDSVLAYNSNRKVEVELLSPFLPSSTESAGDLIREEAFEHCVSALERLRSMGYARPSFLPTPTDLLPAAISPALSKVPLAARRATLPDILVPPDEDLEGLDTGAVELAIAQLGDAETRQAGPLGPSKRRGRQNRVETGKGEMEQRRAGCGPERMGRHARWFGETVPQSKTPSSVVLRAIIGDMIDLYEINRKEAARLILELPLWLRRGTFAGKVSPEDGLFGEAEDEWWNVTSEDGSSVSIEGGWSLDDFIVESILATAFLLVNPPHNALYYTSLLREVVSMTPSTIAPSLGRTVRTIYSALDSGRMDAEVVRRLADWFSVHLSNFNFGWAWKEWVSDMSKPSSHPRVAFAKRIVELEVRLAYHDRIKQTLPVEIQESLMPPEEPSPAFTYSSKDHPYHEQAARLINSIKAKSSAQVIMADFESFKKQLIQDPSAMPTEDDAGKVKTEAEAEVVVRDVAIQAVLLVGSRSFSHFLNIVERYHTLLRQLSSSPAMRIAILAGTTRFWARSAQWVQIVFDKLLQYRIVEPADVIDFIFSPPKNEPSSILRGSGDEVPQSFSRQLAGGFERDWSSFNWWMIVRLTLDKVNGRVDQLKKRLEDREREEAYERERREAAAAAGPEVDEPEQLAPPPLPLFPTSATLPSRPDITAEDIRAEEERRKSASSEEARAGLDAIKTEQRKVLVRVTESFAKLVRLSGALELGPDVGDYDESKWQAWWVRSWFYECVRLFNKQILANQEAILEDVFGHLSEDDPVRQIVERATDMISE